MVDSMVNQLAQVQLFSALKEDDLEAVADLAQAKAYPRGALLFKQGERGGAGYLLARGELRAVHVDSKGVESEVKRLSPGDFFGEGSLLLAEPHEATVEVKQDAVVYVIEKEPFDELLAVRPQILEDLQMSPPVEKRRRAPRFDWQEPDEVSILVLRKHDAVLAERLITPALLALMILIGTYVWAPTSLIAILLGGLLLASTLLFGLYYVVDHFNDRYVLTNRRVVHDEHVYLIHRSRVGARLDNIQSIQMAQVGIAAKSFDYGDLLIETAGEPGGVIAFRQVPHPATVQKTVLRQAAYFETRAREEERAAIEDALQRRLQGEPGEVRSQIEDEAQPAEKDTQWRWPFFRLAPVRMLLYFFPPLREEEGDIITWRKHWVALLGPIARPTAAIALVTLGVAWLLGTGRDQLSILLGYGIVLLFLVPWWLWVFEDWQNEVYQLMPSRIVDIERSPLGLREERREASLGRVQNVSLRMPGLVGRLFGYGSVTVETAGAGAFTFDCVKDPEEVQRTIFRYVEAFENGERQERARRRRDELLDWFTVYDHMRHSERQTESGQGTRSSSDSVSPASPSSG